MTPFVLLSGMMCDARLFTPIIDEITDREVMVLPITAHNTVAELAANVLENAPPIFALAGLSMGGIVAMDVIRQAPERVERLALMDTNPLAETTSVKAHREPQIEKVRAGQLESVMRDEMKPNYLTDGPNRDDILDLCMDMAMTLGDDVFIRQSQALQTRPDQSETLQSYEKPTLILHGEDDRLCPASRHELMHNLMPNSQYAIIKNAGHLPTLEQPKQTLTQISAWLSR